MKVMDTILPMLNLPQYADHPLIHIHRLALDLLKTDDITQYKKLIELLDAKEGFISKEDHGAGKMTAKKIKVKLEKLEFVSDKKWLLEKIEELTNK